MTVQRLNVSAILLFALLLVLPPVNAASPKPLFVHYMPWFRAKPLHSTWGYHWTLARFNPDIIQTNGQRQIGSHYYPLIGPYDSLDPAVLEYHVLLMKLAGIDGVIPDWYGSSGFNDYPDINTNTAALFNWTRRAGLQFAVCYEDQTILHEIENGYIASSGAIAQAQKDMRYLQSNYFNDPSYFKLTNAPVLLDFGPAYFHLSSDWQTIFSVLSPAPAFFPEDNRLSPAALGAFSWPPMWKSVNGTLSLTDLRSYLTDYETKAKTWPSAINSAFPRFNDDYAQSLGVLADNNGATFRETLRRALTNRADLVQVVTFNDFGEGTIIEPTVEFGYRDLGIVQDHRRAYIDPTFSYTTNDLPLAFRLYNLRRANPNPAVTGELNRAFTNIVQGHLTKANDELSALETKQPLILDLNSNGGDVTFSVGGYLSSTGAVLQVLSDTNSSWQNLKTIPVSQTAPIITNQINSTLATLFFRIATGP